MFNNSLYKEIKMTILPTLALRSFVGFDNLFNELETISTQKQNSFPAHDILRISEDEYEITLAVSGFNKEDLTIDVHDGVLSIKGNGGSEVQDDKVQYLYKGIAKRSFEQKFRLEQYVDVKDAKLSNGLLTISLVREIPEERKPRQITLKSA
jgi:molecular chaperone IbpA